MAPISDELATVRVAMALARRAHAEPTNPSLSLAGLKTAAERGGVTGRQVDRSLRVLVDGGVVRTISPGPDSDRGEAVQWRGFPS